MGGEDFFWPFDNPFRGGGAPPKPPKRAKPKGAKEKEAKEKKKKRDDRRRTIMTSSRGVEDEANVGLKTLLGQ